MSQEPPLISEFVNGVQDLELIDLALVSGLLLFSGHLSVKLLLDVLEGHGSGLVLLVELDDVVAELGLYGTAHLSLGHLKASGVKLGYHLAAAKVTQIAALLRGRAGANK